VDAADLQRGLGEAVRSLRKREDLSQEELAHRSDLHTTFISEVERGLRDVRLSTLCKLSGGLDIPVLELIALAERSALR
jgi:XRE family transcriptional regulator, regulator of sulfur utilization